MLLAILTGRPDAPFTTLYEIVGEVPGHPIGLYAREFVDGTTLEELVTAGSVDLRSGIRILATVAEAVSLVHDQGLAHSNLDPSNVLVTASAKPKLIGFGHTWFLAGSDQLPTGVPGVPVDLDVRALRRMLDWLCARLREPIPTPLEEIRQPGSISSSERFAHALKSYLQASASSPPPKR
jgi:serine/threonine protein kinase